ncbi:hypothetical protein H6G80_23105 [Nostoc sp. FACHB-87]|uniref:hypothetical protein n=1 Tax=Nostocaceae TaxID=1162 RepID=UPI0016870D34|nr:MULTISPECIES: hypothetical protein [Nostocaceae]MBD2456952.1 hypothetical protein [Nostoc sp. FACHB-87]MBD2478804.1 hypothetical protein [Anabaena sp. FACHB-83]
MELDLIFNELSLRNLAENERIAQQWMSELIKTIKAFTAQGVKVSLRSQENFHTIMLAPNYPVGRWFNDADQRERLFIKTLVTKAPLSIDLGNSDIQDIENNTGLSEFYYGGELAIGLGIAHLLDTVAVSFTSDECWNCSNIEIDTIQINEDEKIFNESLEIPHSSYSHHVNEHKEWIQKRIRDMVIDGEDIWNRKTELFPNLEFCEVVGRQLKNIRTRQLELQPVFKILYELQQCTENWKTGSFNVKGYALEESGESEATLNQYKNERMFLCPDGEKRLFEKHIKLRFCNWRIHFFPKEPGRVIIGYVGRHLPTVKYKT